MGDIRFGRGRRSGRVAVAIGVIAAVTSAAVLAASAAAAGPPAWTAPVATGTSHALDAISCPSLSLCVGVASNGDVVTSAAPATATPAWALAAPAALTSPTSVSCPPGTFSFCVATVGSGKIAATANPAGAWPSTTIDSGHNLTAVSCPTTALCVAVDNNGSAFTSVDPTAALPIWTQISIDGTTAINSISCPTAAFCAAVDNNRKVLTSTDPTTQSSWQSAAIAANATAISCNAATACVAVDATGTAYATANAGTAPVTWSSTPVDKSPNVPRAVSCTDGGLCVIVDDHGNAITSDNFSAARPAWTAAPVDTTALVGVSCLVAGFCVAVDSNATGGQAAAGISPLGSVTTGTGTASDQTDATLTATVDPGDAAVTACVFVFGTSTAYGGVVPCSTTPAPGGGPQAVSAQISGLTASTTYHFAIEVTTGVASLDGADAIVTTPAPLKANPSLAGTPAVGGTLTCKPNVTTTASEIVAFQWLSDTVPIASANAATYVVQQADAMHHLSCQVTISGDGGSATAVSGFDAVPSTVGGMVVVSVAGTAKRSARGTVNVPVTCSSQAAGSCTFTLTLTTPGIVKHKRKKVTIGSATAKVALGATKTLTVALNATGRTMLSRKHRLAVTFTVQGTLLGTLTAALQTDKFTFTQAKAKRQHATRHAKAARHATRRPR